MFVPNLERLGYCRTSFWENGFAIRSLKPPWNLSGVRDRGLLVLHFRRLTEHQRSLPFDYASCAWLKSN